MTLTTGGSFSDKVNFIWSVADLLRGDFKQSEYGRVIHAGGDGWPGDLSRSLPG